MQAAAAVHMAEKGQAAARMAARMAVRMTARMTARMTEKKPISVRMDLNSRGS